ncbi:pirin family protein [Yersinia aleksiciae]|uniref:Pirin family protein n=1 Tax=Yersinia aleksiciae TaxID=263819 RepID=A0A0T9TAN7_YERAE|nr:pirin family protein [Yersinia aleksiciae]MDA5496983.1 pirin family protein [Yersinia aleksiciae]NIK98635.1 pirin family protein [Yersinia aleksiciae]WQC72445.1 pirin family protein [Yersinia aleksiciae]CNK71132.1 pirin family protein [Yersinia aleksiciae]
MKKVQGIYRAPRQHWVGDGFPVRSLFSYQSHGKQLSPFLLLDYAGPADFTPTTHRRGVGQHPHRGFETVTIVYHGEVEHRDSTGKGGVIGPGDVQWMTAGGGILHEEFHAETFAQRGGAFEMVQLWVNLPAKDKMTAPGYQAIRSDSIPQVDLPDDAGSLRVIAGDYSGEAGPAHTFSPLNVWDIRLNQGKSAEFSLPVGWNTALIVLRGSVLVNGDAIARDAEMVLLDAAGSHVTIEANNDALLLLLSGEPIDEPIIGYGPFVMNTQQQINEAIADFNSGRFGSMDSPS